MAGCNPQASATSALGLLSAPAFRIAFEEHRRPQYLGVDKHIEFLSSLGYLWRGCARRHNCGALLARGRGALPCGAG